MINTNNNPDTFQYKRQGKDTENNEVKQEAILLNPLFDELKKPETFLNHIQELKEQSTKKNQLKSNSFPVEVFPKPIQEIITETNKALNYPIDFIGASILYAISVSIGNSHRVEIMKGYEQNAVLYLAIVGRAGTNKSHPLSFALNPIEQRDNSKFQKFQHDKQEFEKASNLTKKEREKQGIDEPIKPIWEQLLVTDFTPEALIDVHKYNKRGIGVYVDELASWFKNFNRYNKGSEEQFWLSVWSGKPIRINRKTSEPTYIELPFISVAGTIQPAVLNELAKDRTENGFLDRLLFVIPNQLKKEYWSETEINPVVIDNWKNIINKLLDVPIIQDEEFNPQSEILKFTAEAKQLFFKWQREITDISNKAENVVLSGIYAKMEQYALRFSLCLEMARFACNESDKQAIGIESVEGAIRLIEYFKNSALKVHSIVSSTNPVDKLPTDKQILYNNLPEYFTTSEGVQFAKNSGIAERTFKYFIGNRELFNNPKRGEYEKLF